ncbi:MAG TPA: hypothetical protein VF444_01565 [Pseudonocardiaceae bacterium]
MSYPSFKAAKQALGNRDGQQIHHLTEQCQVKPQRSGFSVERINTTDNLVWLPEPVHRRVSGRYSRTVFGTDKILRDYLNGRDWDYQYDRGIREVNRAMEEQERHDSGRD